MRRPAFSLIEVLAALTILGVVLGMATPPVLRWTDTLAVRAARDELVSALALTRLTAVARGGATLVLEPAEGRLRAVAGDLEVLSTDLGERYGVRLTGVSDSLAVRYDALGIGRTANSTVVVSRGRARASVVVSLYGRVRSW